MLMTSVFIGLVCLSLQVDLGQTFLGPEEQTDLGQTFLGPEEQTDLGQTFLGPEEQFGLWQTLLGPEEPDLPRPFHLTVTPKRVINDITKNVVLRCEGNASVAGYSTVKKIDRMKILKMTASDKWELIAEQNYTGSAVVKNPKISVSGEIDSNVAAASFLEIQWAVAEDETFGTYKCDVRGKDENDNFRVELTSEIELQQSEMTTDDIFALLLKTKNEIESAITKNVNDISALKALKASKQRNVGLDKDLLKNEFLLRNKTIAWPNGEYALLQPDTGCPVDLAFFGGNSGYVRIHTESNDGRSANNLHSQNHLSPPVLTKSDSKYFLYLRFCVVTRVFSETSWPDGAFCVHMKGGNCPAEFSQGKISLDTEDHQNSDMHGGNVPFSKPSELLFCCKNNADPLVPISLPTESPFYLYRYGGQCQKVRDMDVMPEFVEIDTENYFNKDYKVGNVPDSDLERDSLVRIELCYYSKR
ncbi:Apextrin-like protein [Plakobranchus ocellatus]|uniref:Apextrin-like protein n=1 Tax=Plakobranchus ocellatus TaxID=259542 RepID=A0AAV4D245_9GAST|nr:Apextrin-like protein [Plakobranchus ocellatus]